MPPTRTRLNSGPSTSATLAVAIEFEIAIPLSQPSNQVTNDVITEDFLAADASRLVPALIKLSCVAQVTVGYEPVTASYAGISSERSAPVGGSVRECRIQVPSCLRTKLSRLCRENHVLRSRSTSGSYQSHISEKPRPVGILLLLIHLPSMY